MVVRDGAELEIGAHKLKFVVAPMLHWPDSMMTYHEDDKVLLSCDFWAAILRAAGVRYLYQIPEGL